MHILMMHLIQGTHFLTMSKMHRKYREEKTDYWLVRDPTGDDPTEDDIATISFTTAFRGTKNGRCLASGSFVRNARFRQTAVG